MLANCNAFDLILVQSSSRTIAHPASACSDCLFRFGNLVRSRRMGTHNDRSGLKVYLVVVDPINGVVLRFPIRNDTIQAPESCCRDNNNEGMGTADDKHDGKALAQLACCLQPGNNTARFLLVDSHKSDAIVGIAPMRIHLWTTEDKIVVVDVDGTVSKFTLTGFWTTAVMRDYNSHTSICHSGVCEFLSAIPRVRFVYLTNRPIAYAEPTRGLLHELRQGLHQLPEGPLIGFTGNLAGVVKVRLCAHAGPVIDAITSMVVLSTSGLRCRPLRPFFHLDDRIGQMDFYHSNAHEFKYDTLKKYVAQPFQDLGASDVFYAGFGNTDFDMHAYHNAGVDLHRMFLIDKQSQIYCLDRKEHEDADSDVRLALNHPKEYATARGTMFTDGYQDAKLLAYVLRLRQDVVAGPAGI